MTSTQPVQRGKRPTPPGRRMSPIRVAILAVAILGIAGAAYGGWYLFLQTPAAPVALASLPPSASTAVGASSTAASSGTSAGLDGTWKVDTTVGSFSDFTSTFLGYRVKETLGSIGANTAVGRTPNVTGSLTISGKTISAVDITADLTTLQSDSNLRDGQLRRQAIQTSTFPTATFKLTAPIVLDAVPTDGATLTATATGDLTLHGVTKSVQIPIQARLSGNTVTVVGSLPIVFADYSISKPQSQAVLDIEDHGVMELQLIFAKA